MNNLYYISSVVASVVGLTAAPGTVELKSGFEKVQEMKLPRNGAGERRLRNETGNQLRAIVLPDRPLVRSPEASFADLDSLLIELAHRGIPNPLICAIIKYVNNPFGWSALNYAIQEKDYKAAMLLADCVLDINPRDSAFSTNLNSVSKINALERVLLQAQFAEKQKMLTKDQILLIYKLIDKGIEYDGKPVGCVKSPIYYLCFFGEIRLVGMLLDKGVNINSNDGELLSISTARGHTELVRYLINR